MSEVAHASSVEHVGSFAHAVCTCRWRGPGRRSIARSVEDGATHDALAGLATVSPAPGFGDRVIDLTDASSLPRPRAGSSATAGASEQT